MTWVAFAAMNVDPFSFSSIQNIEIHGDPWE